MGPRALISDEEDDMPINEMMRRPVPRGQKWGTRPTGPGGAVGAGRGDDGEGAGRGVNARNATVHTSLHNYSEHDGRPPKKILHASA